jgi:hypothetical protein
MTSLPPLDVCVRLCFDDDGRCPVSVVVVGSGGGGSGGVAKGSDGGELRRYNIAHVGVWVLEDEVDDRTYATISSSSSSSSLSSKSVSIFAPLNNFHSNHVVNQRTPHRSSHKHSLGFYRNIL